MKCDEMRWDAMKCVGMGSYGMECIGTRSEREGGSSVYLSVCDRIPQTCCTKTLPASPPVLLLLCTLVAGDERVSPRTPGERV